MAQIVLFVIAMYSELNRAVATRQYFEIRNALNRANRIRNLKTELEFVLRENSDGHFIIVKSSGAENGFLVALRNADSKFWVLSKNEIYEDFYKYMFLKIRTLNLLDDIKINLILTNWLSGLWVI